MYQVDYLLADSGRRGCAAADLERIQQQMTSRTEQQAGHGLDYSRRRGMQEFTLGAQGGAARPGGWRRRQRGAASVMM